MRDATKEERESIDNYIKSISHTIDDEVDLPIKHESKPYLMIPFPDGATNGDVIKAVFPNADYEIGKQFVHITNVNSVGELSIPLTWWNAPYEKEVSK